MPASTGRDRVRAAVLASLCTHALLALLVARLPGWRRATAEEAAPPPAGGGLRVLLEPAAPVPGPPLPGRPVELAPGPEMSATVSDPPSASAAPAGVAPTVAVVREGPPGVGRSGSGGTVEGGSGLFAAARAARSVVFVLDCSVSMGPSGALDFARRELLARLWSLPAGTRFQVVAYSRVAELAPVEPREALLEGPDAAEAVARWLGGLTAGGGTDHVRGLRRGLLLRPEALVLITDAGGLAPQDVALITRLNAGRTAIHVVELGAGLAGEGALAGLARANGGSHRRIAHGP